MTDCHIDEVIRKKLVDKHACYVLITCDVPDQTGHMNVQMSYEGDPALAAFMLDGARDYIADNEVSPRVLGAE